MAARSKLVIRQQALMQENLDSDKSVSDEELHGVTYDIVCSKNLQPLYSHKKVQSTPASHVESLTGGDHHPTTATYKEDFTKRNPSTLPKETQARPRFPFTYAAAGVKRGGSTNLERESQQEACEWPAILDEVNELAGLQGRAYNSFNPSVVPEEKRFHKGAKGSSRFKFSFRYLSNKEDLLRDCFLSKDETSCEEDIEGLAEWDYFEYGNEEDTMPHLLGNILVGSAELANKQFVGGAPSVSELLEDMQKTDQSLRINSAVDNIKGKERQTPSKRASLYLGNRVLDNKVAREFTGDISSEDESIDQDYRTAQIVKGQTMADLFQEAFNTSTEERAEIPSSIKFGYHGRLLHLMQLEKDRHMEYLKQSQTGLTPSNELNCINVRILSRTVEAKLTVCHCLFGENSKSLECKKSNQGKCEMGLLEGFGNGGSMKKTIIFSPTFCSNVELELGNIVCIHPPWKIVQVNGGETIILCTYYSSPL